MDAHAFATTPMFAEYGATRIDAPDSDVVLHRDVFAPVAADRLFEELTRVTPWQQDHIRIHGRELPVPRLNAWHGERAYSYSGIDLAPQAWNPPLLEVRAAVERLVGERWRSNSVLVNLYRDGRDSVAWHADDEPELGPEPAIASVSLGAVRRFHMRHRTQPDERVHIELPHNSVLVMRGPTQHHWMHQVPKTAKPVGPRVNLTYRYVVPAPPRRAPSAPASPSSRAGCSDRRA